MDGNWHGASTMTGAPPQARPPAQARLLLLTSGKRISQVIYALAEVGVADVLADGPLPVTEIAERTATDPDALRRLLRCASAVGVFTEQDEGVYALTEMAEALRSDVPGSQRDMVLFNGSDLLWFPYGEIVSGLRTGRPVFSEIFGSEFFDHLRANPEAGALFDRAMTRMSAATTGRFLDAYDFGRFADVVDVGGGRGHFLAGLLERHPHVRGTLVDQPQVVTEAAAVMAERGVADRVRLTPGDFFGELPSGHRAYILKAVLHDWNDEDAAAILRRVGDAMGGDPGARLLVLEHVLAPANVWDHGKVLDIDMMLRFGGRERDLAEWRALLGSAGFEIVNSPGAGQWTVIECRRTGATEATEDQEIR